MKYPIDTEKYIQAMRLEFGENRAAEEAHRVIIPSINACYEDGLQGENGYPLDPDKERKALAKAEGKSLEAVRNNPLIPPLIAWCNRAYEQGREEAGCENPV